MSNHSVDGLSLTEIQDKIKLSPNPSRDSCVIAAVQQYLKTHKQDYTSYDAIRWINIMGQTHEPVASNHSRLCLVRKKTSIKHPALLNFIRQNKFTIKTARLYLTELLVYSSELRKHHYVLGFAHENEGYFVTSPLLNGWVEEASLSFIRGKNSRADKVHIFLDYKDYLSLLCHLQVQGLPDDAIILHVPQVAIQLKAYFYQSPYQKVFSWLPDNAAGKQVLQQLTTLLRQNTGLHHLKMNRVFHGFHSLNEWFRSKDPND